MTDPSTLPTPTAASQLAVPLPPPSYSHQPATEAPAWPLVTRRRTSDRWPIRRWLLVVGAITMVFAILAVLVGTVALTRLTTARSVVLSEILPAQQAAEDLTRAVLNQETGVRGFLLTGREEFLRPYEDGLAGERAAVAELRRLHDLEHLGDIGDRLNAAADLAERWRRDFAEPTIQGVRDGTLLPQFVDVALGRTEFEQLRLRLADLDEHLDTTLNGAILRLQDANSFLRVVFIGIAVALVGLIVAVGVWLRRAVTTPLSSLAAEVRAVVSGDAHRRVRGDGPAEIVELGYDIDAMRRHILTELDALEQAHRRLDEQARDLERSNRDLEQFAYVASHDLQEPLRKVSSFCQLLQRRYSGQMDERADSYIEFAVDGARRMQQLINDLLAFSRVGRLTTGFADVDLNAVADTALSQLSTAREEAGAEITVRELPTVRGESGLLLLLLTNLIGNALKFHRPGVPPVVEVSAEPHDDGWEIAVADNGIGVEPEYADKVFVIFQRLHAREEYSGTGIGLAMAKKIVEYHGGRIWIDPGRTDGATVRFTLPGVTPSAAVTATHDMEEQTP
ncbi:MAG TPA: ATP-binding protein [Pseudonocardiaceae bacterium]